VENVTLMRATPIYQQMKDNGNGTYTSTYLTNVEGTLTIIAYLYIPGKIRVDWYDSTIFEAPIEHQEEWTEVNVNWGFNELYPTKIDSVTAKIYFHLKIPFTETYKFMLVSNDGSALFVENIIKVSRSAETCNCSDEFDMDLVADEYYQFR
jgi:hypothetical protein